VEQEMRHLHCKICALDPLADKDTARIQFERTALKVVNGWALKFPEDKTKGDHMMAWTTYKAICRRNGGPYKSQGADKITYDWLPQLFVYLFLSLPFSILFLFFFLFPPSSLTPFFLHLFFSRNFNTDKVSGLPQSWISFVCAGGRMYC
jgi:hypothetical protein